MTSSVSSEYHFTLSSLCFQNQMDPYDLREDLLDKIRLGKEMLAQLANNKFKKVQGLPKLEKKVRQELKFLEKFETPENFCDLKKEHISCSNLVHLGSIIEQLCLVENPSSVLQPFNLTEGCKVKKICVDIVCDKGTDFNYGPWVDRQRYHSLLLIGSKYTSLRQS